jgi:hypothetical protein
MWGSFLGAPPTIWYRGQRRQRLIAPELEADADANGGLTGEFVRTARQALARAGAGS